MQTIGSVVDQLIVVNLKLFHLEEVRNNLSAPDNERLRASDKISILNKQRNQLIDEIDVIVDQAIKNGYAPVNLKMKLY